MWRARCQQAPVQAAWSLLLVLHVWVMHGAALHVMCVVHVHVIQLMHW
jgi:hypothetical protein